MTQINIEEYGESIKKAIDLALEYEQECNEDFREKDPEEKGYYEADLSSINIDELISSGKEKELIDFLEANDYELTKILCIIMWVGRDSSLQEKDGTYDYSKIREDYDKSGWNPNKSCQIDYLVEKTHLFTYLRKGMEKLNIRL